MSDTTQAQSERGMPATFHRNAAPQMLRASQNARATFKHFWKEVALDFSRPVPALSLAAVKVAFSDNFADSDAPVEHMWVEKIDFDGVAMTGVLMNAPNELMSVAAGDTVTFPIAQLGDWIGVIKEKVYGGYTVQLTRAGMDTAERARYDAAWGLSFPPPATVHVPDGTSPFETVIANEMRKQIPANPSLLAEKFDGGRTLLHLEALYGRTISVRALLALGADRTLRCDRNWTPLDYARALNWTEIIQQLSTPASNPTHQA